MQKNNYEFSIFDNSAEKCCSGIKFGDCAYCNKKGIPILLARYSVRSLNNLGLCKFDTNQNVANAMPWDLSCTRTVKIRHLENKNEQMQESFESRTLDPAVEYILRRPRQGYLYVYDKVIHGGWCCYSINKNGYVRTELLSRPTPLDELPDFKCTKDSSHIAMGSIITLPNPEISRVVYLCYVEATWSKEWRDKISKDAAWREQHMQKIVVEKNLSCCDIFSLDELEKIVLEYSNDYYLMGEDSAYSMLKDIACLVPGNVTAIAQFVKKTLCDYAKKEGGYKPVILALHDDTAITLHLNELRLAPHIELDELSKKDDDHRPYLWAASIMVLEQALQKSPYASMVFDPSVDDDIKIHQEGRKYSKTKPIPDDYSQPDIAHGKPYSEIKKENDEYVIRGEEENEQFKKDWPYIYPLIYSQEKATHGGVYISPFEQIQASWSEKSYSQEQLLAEFYEGKYFDFSKYKEIKKKLTKVQARIDTESERVDFDYCWWLKNKLPNALACYDPDDQLHRTVVTSLLARALIGGIVGQSSRNLWQDFHKAPEQYPVIINGILGWNDELGQNLINSLSNDCPGPINIQQKHKTLFEAAYIKEVGKLVKKGHSLVKGFHEFIDKDLSLKALNALRDRCQKAQLIADTVESTHKTLLLDVQYLVGDDSSLKNFAQETAFVEKHSSGLRVTQFKMFRIMLVSKLMTGDLIAKITAIDEARQKNYFLEQKRAYLEERYARKSAELVGCEKAARHLTFIEMPINEVQKEIKRISLRRISAQLNAMEAPSYDVGSKNIQKNTVNNNGDIRVVGNTYNIDGLGNSMMEFPVFYSDEESSAIVSATAENSGDTSTENSAENKVVRQGFGRKIFDHYSKAMNSDFSNRWVGRISRIAIYWGFIESFCTLIKSPSDLKAWWKMSGSVISVTQAYFDVWEMEATEKINVLETAKSSGYLLEKETLVVDDVVSALTKEVNFAKLWSKKLGVLGSLVSIIDGFRELGHAIHMREHGELPSDVSIVEEKALIGIASGVVGVLLVETAVFGGVLVILAFIVALWLLPSTENLIPLGIRNWLRRSQFGRKEGLNYLPFKNWIDEQSSFEMVLKGIEVDIGVHYYTTGEIADRYYKEKAGHNISGTIRFPSDLCRKIKILFSYFSHSTNSYEYVFEYDYIKDEKFFIETGIYDEKEKWYLLKCSEIKTQNGISEISFSIDKLCYKLFNVNSYVLEVVDDEQNIIHDYYRIFV